MAGLYVHIPFCLARCAYCDFLSFAVPPGSPEIDLYLDALEREIELRSATLDVPFDTVYIGGGTPTVLSPTQLGRLLRSLRRFRAGPDAEVTVEANPGTVDEARLDALRMGGANRLSLGVQTLEDRLLERAGRVHRAADAAAAVGAARAAGFANISVDLIYGLPGQTVTGWATTLRSVIDMGLEHVSAYALMVEEDTPFGGELAAGRLDLPSETDQETMGDLVTEVLADGGYEKYEISNYARPGCRCRHNLNYWENGPYIGLGLGAWSHWEGARCRNYHQPAAYTAALAGGRIPTGEKEDVGGRTEMIDTAIMGLRLADGLDLAGFERRFGMAFSEAFPVAGRLLETPWLEAAGGRLRLTPAGLKVSNRILAEFVDRPCPS